MPWTLRLEDEDGVRQSEDRLVVEFGSLPTGKNFPISTLIEASPHFDTLLNPVQVMALIAEMDSAAIDLNWQDIDLRAFAEVATMPHIYLRFVGD